jgi:predicted RNase H-like HicB family nuclease
MLRYHVAFYLPHAPGETVAAEALDFPGAVSQGFDLQDALLMIASALKDLAPLLLEESKPIPVPSKEAHSPDADLIELVRLSVHAGSVAR